MKKVSTLFKLLLLYCGSQIILVACGCDSFYSVFRFDDEAQLALRGRVQTFSKGMAPYKIVSEGDTLTGDSCLIELTLDSEFIEDVDLAGLQGFMSTAMASSPCNPEYFETTDTVLDFDIFTLDTFNLVPPNGSLLRVNGIDEERKSAIITENTDIYTTDFRTEVWLIEKPKNQKVAIGIWIAMASGDTLRTTFSEAYWK